jgi:Flp pilus assembly protein CpaB
VRLSLFRLRRSPLGFWLVAALLALLTGTTVSRIVGRAEAASAEYGARRTVVVARRDIDAGTRLSAGDVSSRLMPAAFVPSGGVAGASAAIGRVIVVPLVRGQVLVDRQLAPRGLSSAAALVAPGTRAIALPTNGLAPPLRLGDVVDVYATFDDGKEPPTFAVARGVTVVATNADDGSVTVAVDDADVDRVAFAVTTGEVTIVLAGGER